MEGAGRGEMILNDSQMSGLGNRWMLVPTAKAMGRSCTEMIVNASVLKVIKLQCCETSKWSCQKAR